MKRKTNGRKEPLNRLRNNANNYKTILYMLFILFFWPAPGVSGHFARSRSSWERVGAGLLGQVRHRTGNPPRAKICLNWTQQGER